jgi:hypothetical protein
MPLHFQEDVIVTCHYHACCWRSSNIHDWHYCSHYSLKFDMLYLDLGCPLFHVCWYISGFGISITLIQLILT